ncbi:MAG: hypothetical protein ABEJ65_08070, partial [bacterium]
MGTSLKCKILKVFVGCLIVSVAISGHIIPKAWSSHSVGYGLDTIGDTYHTLYIDRNTSYLGDHEIDIGTKSTSAGNRRIKGRSHETGNRAYVPFAVDLLENWNIRSDGVIEGNDSANVSNHRSTLEAPMKGVVSDTKLANLITGVVNDTSVGQDFTKGQFVINTRYSQSTNGITNGDSRYIGAAVNIRRSGGEQHAGLGLGTLDLTSS